jgi:hypothetical protein
LIAAGILPICTTKISDHSPIFLDFNGELLLGGKGAALARLAVRRLSVKNAQSVLQYLTYALEHCYYHRIEDRIDHLIQAFLGNDRVLSHGMRTSLFNLDRQFVEICLAAEKQCSKKGIHTTDWSPAFKRAGCCVSYWKYRLRDPSFNGDAISRKLGKEAGLEIWETDRCILPAECKQSLAEANAWFSCLKRDAWQYRKFFQEDLASIAAEGNDIKKQGILKAIKFSERSTRAFRRIANALGKSRTGLTKLIVPNPDGGESVLFAKDPIHNHLIARNFKHYGQANETVFGADGGNAHLIDPANPDNISDKLLEGTAGFDISHLSSESQEWLGCLVRSAKTDISMEISENDFIQHYKRMPEKKSSSPSLKHVGHYIVAAKAEDPTLRNIVTKIAYLSLIASVPLPR